MLFEGADLLFELVDVVGDAEAGFVPGLFAERFGEALFELLNSGGEADGALVCVGEVGLHGRPADDGTDAWRVWRLGFGGVVGCPEDFGQWVIDNIH